MAQSDIRNRIGVGLLTAAFAFLVGTITVALWNEGKTLADPDDSRQVAKGKLVYDRLFGIIKEGLVPGKYAPPKYESDMPVFGRMLTDDGIWAVLAYIKSSWPSGIRKAQHEMTRERERR